MVIEQLKKLDNLLKNYQDKNNDIYQLIKQNNYDEIYKKYGQKEYDRTLNNRIMFDIKIEKGSRLRIFKYELKKLAMAGIILTGINSITFPLICNHAIIIAKKENAKKYEKNINNYNNSLKEYAKNINSLNLTDTQIIMKVIYDMWRDIDGYGTPQIDAPGYYRLDIANGIGVCRNMADDFTAKMNAINPDYQAKNIVVAAKQTDWTLANIDTRIVDSGEQQEQSNIDYSKIIGNHMVSIVQIPDKNIILVVDPTNPGIGVLKNNKIYMFTSSDGKGLVIKDLGNFVIDGYNNMLPISIDKLQSYFTYNISTLEDEYGLESQNQAIKMIEKI